MLARTFAFLEPFVAMTRPSRLVLVRRFLIALKRALRAEEEREGACVVASNVFGLPASVLQSAATNGPDALDLFLERALAERLEAAPEGLDARADWLVRWGPLVEALVPDGPHGASPVPDMVTLAPDLAALFARLPELSRSPLPLTLEGAPGTGRESFARVVHQLHRAPRPYIAWDCQLAQSEEQARRALFGHPLAPGLITRAGEGTLVLRNAEALPPGAQHALARCLETGRVVDGYGQGRELLRARLVFVVDAQTLASAGPGLGTLHPDLAWRAATLHASLPPLAERGEDLAALYRNIVRRFVLKREQPLSPDEVAREPRMTLTPRALLALYAYSWPGNVAEFVSVVRESRQRAGAGPVELAHLPERVVAALGRPGEKPEDRLRRLLVEVAPAAVSGPEHLQAARRRLRQWRDDQLDLTLDRETTELFSRTLAAFNALRHGSHDPMPLDAALAQVRAAAAREILVPTASAVPLFWEERAELVAELEAIAAAQALPGALARRLFDLGRALVLYPRQARAQLSPQYVDNEQRPSAVALALIAAAG